MGLEAPAVFGVSFGGAIALELAAEHPDRLGALIVHGVEAAFRPTIGSKIARRVLERFPLPSDSRFINQFFHLLFGSKPEPGPLVDFVVDRIWETGQTRWPSVWRDSNRSTFRTGSGASVHRLWCWRVPAT